MHVFDAELIQNSLVRLLPFALTFKTKRDTALVPRFALIWKLITVWQHVTSFGPSHHDDLQLQLTDALVEKVAVRLAEPRPDLLAPGVAVAEEVITERRDAVLLAARVHLEATPQRREARAQLAVDLLLADVLAQRYQAAVEVSGANVALVQLAERIRLPVVVKRRKSPVKERATSSGNMTLNGTRRGVPSPDVIRSYSDVMF